MLSDTPWTDAKIARLTQLWAEGLATAEIGRRLNLSKNAVVGKAHRLRLSERPSPIKPGEGGRPRRTAPVPGGRPGGWPTLPGLACLRRPLAAAAPDRALLPSPPSPGLEASALGAPTRPRAAQPCCWPLGEPGSPRFRYCEAPATAGKPYCAAHCRLAYVRPRGCAGDRVRAGEVAPPTWSAMNAVCLAGPYFPARSAAQHRATTCP